MLIEFCCPVCLAPLSVEPKIAGGQVNCPKCLKLILIPEKTVLARSGETAAFSPGLTHKGDVVAKAISLSVEPYRRELETKTGLLNDAVDMIKTRNQRIKEIEGLILKTQKDLWELDVVYDDHQSELDRVRRELGERLEKAESDSAAVSVEESSRAVLEEQVQKLVIRVQELEESKESLKHRLAHLDAHSRMQRSELDQFSELVGSLGPLEDFVRASSAFEERQRERLAERDRELTTAREYLVKAAGELDRLQSESNTREQFRLSAEQERQTLQNEMQTLLHSTSQDVQYALKERDQWKHRAEELRAEMEKLREQSTWDNEDLGNNLAALRTEFRHQEGLLEDALRVQQDLSEDRRQSVSERKELEQSLELLRKRIDQERHELQIRSEGEKSTLLTEAAKRESTLENKLRLLRADFAEQETRLAEALRNQAQLAEQSLRSEKQRSELKKQLDLAMERLEADGLKA